MLLLLLLTRTRWPRQNAATPASPLRVQLCLSSTAGVTKTNYTTNSIVNNCFTKMSAFVLGQTPAKQGISRQRRAILGLYTYLQSSEFIVPY